MWGKKPKEFVPYKGQYEKKLYDVKLKDGRIIEGCWPNAGHFIPLYSQDADVPGKDVAEYRLSKTHSF